MYFSHPAAQTGYYRGWPVAGGQGSGQGNRGDMAVSNMFNATGSTTGWTPTILYMFVLILLEMVIFAVLSRHI